MSHSLVSEEIHVFTLLRFRFGFPYQNHNSSLTCHDNFLARDRMNEPRAKCFFHSNKTVVSEYSGRNAILGDRHQNLNQKQRSHWSKANVSVLPPLLTIVSLPRTLRCLFTANNPGSLHGDQKWLMCPLAIEHVSNPFIWLMFINPLWVLIFGRQQSCRGFKRTTSDGPWTCSGASL